MNQAKAVGRTFTEMQIDRIYCSDLKRAHWTAKEVYKANRGMNSGVSTRSCEALADDDDECRPAKRARTEPASRPDTSQLVEPLPHSVLREQHFGKAEGLNFEAARSMSAGGDRRKSRFPNGESLDDVNARAKQVIERIIKPWAIVSNESDHHIVIVAHGIMIAELSRALLLLNPGTTQAYSLGPLNNTAYHQVEIFLASAGDSLSPALLDQAKTITGTQAFPDEQPFGVANLRLPLRVKVLKTSQNAHLSGLKKQKGGIGSGAFDSKQQAIKNFFGGSQSSPGKL